MKIVRIEVCAPASVKHVRHESRGGSCSRRINNVGNNSGEGGSNSIGDDRTRCRPSEDFNLSRSVQNHIAVQGGK